MLWQADLHTESKKRQGTKKALADALAAAKAQGAEQETRDKQDAAARKLQSAWRTRKLNSIALERLRDAEVSCRLPSGHVQHAPMSGQRCSWVRQLKRPIHVVTILMCRILM